jgi:hypothetical protein
MTDRDRFLAQVAQARVRRETMPPKSEEEARLDRAYGVLVPK